jgi:hypothetical protein
MINGVLVERTVKDVIPALKTNAEGLKKVLDDLVKTYKAKQDELEVWKVCSCIRSQPSENIPPWHTDMFYSDYRRRIMSRWCRIERVMTMYESGNRWSSAVD